MSRRKNLCGAMVSLVVSACGSESDTQVKQPPGEDQGSARVDMMSASDLSALPLDDMSPDDMREPPHDMLATPDDMRVSEDMPEDMPAVDMPAALDMTPPDVACDYREREGVVVWQAEAMSRVEDWQVGVDGDVNYLVWEGRGFSNDPTHGVMAVKVRIDTPGRYRLHTRNRIGMGTDPTEHNDFWARFSDATDYYGLKTTTAPEERRYPKPICEDAAAVARIEADASVKSATCVKGSSRDGWLKVYSSGATSWKWSTFTSDNDASRVMAEFDSPGVYTFEMAARSNFLLIDRIVLHEESISEAVAQDTAPSPCP